MVPGVQMVRSGRLPSFFPLVFLFALAPYDLTRSTPSERLEQANLLERVRGVHSGGEHRGFKPPVPCVPGSPPSFFLGFLL